MNLLDFGSRLFSGQFCLSCPINSTKTHQQWNILLILIKNDKISIQSTWCRMLSSHSGQAMTETGQTTLAVCATIQTAHDISACNSQQHLIQWSPPPTMTYCIIQSSDIFQTGFILFSAFCTFCIPQKLSKLFLWYFVVCTYWILLSFM